MQQAVGGSIEAVYPYEDPVAVICNEEGKLIGLPTNRALKDEDGNIYDILAGKFLIVGLGEENFSDLSPDLMAKYKEKFSTGNHSTYRRKICVCQTTGAKRAGHRPYNESLGAC